MSMSKLVAMLGSAASGYNAGLTAKEEREDRARKRQQDQEDRDFNMAERARAKKMRDDMGAAAAPVAVEQVQPAGPVMDGAEGAAGQPIPMVSTVQGKSFATPDEAGAAAAAQNTPQAVTGRMADVAMRNGDPVKAQQLRVGSMQEQTGQYQLNAAMRADLDAKFNDDLQKNVTDWASFDRFTSDSAGDGMGGAVKLKTLPSADGKSMVVHVIGPDGVPTPTGKVFPNTADGLALASAELARMPAEKKLAHLHQKAMEARQAEQAAATAAHQAGTLAETSRHNLSMEDVAKGNTAARAAKAGAGQPAGINMADADKFINHLFSRKDEVTGAAVFDPNGANTVRALMLRMPAAQEGDTQGAVNQALALYQAAMKRAGGDHDKALVELQRAANPQPASPNPAAAPPKAAPAPAAPKAPPAEKAPAPAGSPQAAWEARQAKARADMAAAADSKAAEATALSTQFQADKAALSPIDLARKYDKTRGKLSAKDAAEL